MKGDLEVLGSEFIFSFQNQELHLNTQRSLFWSEQKMLVVSDLHLGKAGHFRRHGIPIPRQIHISDLLRVNSLLEYYQPKTILFLGDLFHSDQNDEWSDFIHWSNYNHQVNQILVQGNHDILSSQDYNETRIQLLSQLDEGPFSFTHEPTDTFGYNIAGHIHPAIRLRGLARQGEILPCFSFELNHALLPAFGNFTGNHPIKPRKGASVFAIAEDVLVSLTA